jgi:hypothetical protein
MSRHVWFRDRSYWFNLGLRHGFIEYGHRRLVWSIFTVKHDPPTREEVYRLNPHLRPPPTSQEPGRVRRIDVVLEWRRSAERGERAGLRLRVNPTCEMYVGAGKERCGKSATARIHYLPYWSLRWCPEHAEYFIGRDAA